MAKTCAFKAAIRQMLDLVIHSLYSKKEIFLRELISNGSDAIDRAKYLALTDKTIAPEAPEWQITLRADATAHTLTVEDNGLGMSAEEMEEAPEVLQEVVEQVEVVEEFLRLKYTVKIMY